MKLLTPLDPDAVHSIPGWVAAEYKVIPIRLDGNKRCLLCPPSLTDEQKEQLVFICGGELEFIIDPKILPDIRQNFLRVLAHYYFQVRIHDLMLHCDEPSVLYSPEPEDVVPKRS